MMRKKKHALFAFHGHRLDKLRNYQYNILAIGVWRSLVSRLVRVQEASGSNPDTPTKKHPIIGCFFPKLLDEVGLYAAG